MHHEILILLMLVALFFAAWAAWHYEIMYEDARDRARYWRETSIKAHDREDKLLREKGKIADELRTARKELARILAGQLTPDEFHAIVGNTPLWVTGDVAGTFAGILDGRIGAVKLPPQ